MKFLVMGKRNQLPMDPKMGIAVFQAGKQRDSGELASGGMDVQYFYADGTGGFAIVNGDSHEEVYDKILEAPYYGFMDWEVIPLIDPSHGFDKLVETMQKMAAMM